MRKWVGILIVVSALSVGCGDDLDPLGLYLGTSNRNNQQGGTSGSGGIVATRADFVDISATGQSLNLGDDEVSVVPLPFTVTLGGRAFQSVNVCSNGFLHFGTPNPSFANSALPDVNSPDPILAVYWDDLAPPAAPWVFTETRGTAPNRSFIVMWRNAQTPFAPGKGITVEAIVRESGSVELQYLDTSFNDPAFNAGASATVGFQVAGQGQTWCFNGAPNQIPSNSGLILQP